MTDADWKLLFSLNGQTESNFGRLEAAVIIENDGSSPDAINPNTGESALIIACKLGMEKTALFLAGVVTDIEGPGSESHLLHAINYKCYHAAKVLIERGADTNITDEHDYSLPECIEGKIGIELEVLELITDKLKRETDASMTEARELPFKLFNEDDMASSLKKETVDRRKRYLTQLIDSGDKRALTGLRSGVIEQVHAMRDKFPNFSEAIDFYLRQLALCNLSTNKTIKIPPVLLSGEPGIGKTRFASELARILELSFSVVACGTTTSSFVLAGGCASWNDARPGQIILTLQNSEDANPLILLDEVDKMCGEKQYDPMAPLYQLLEESTAHQFVDEMIELPVDASAINWIGTGNDLHTIPDPILSRFVVINVRAPTQNEMKSITKSIYADVIECNNDKWGSYFCGELDDEVTTKLTGIAPRKIKQLLVDACGRSAIRNPDAIPLIVTIDDLELNIAKGKTNIGFVH